MFDFLLQNAILSALFGLSLLAGVISNSVYAADNLDLYYDRYCDYVYNYDYEYGYATEVCDDLYRVYSSEVSAAVS